MSLFRKPKRNVRQRQVDSDDEKKEDDESLSEIHSVIEKVKGSKRHSKSKKGATAASNENFDGGEKKSSLLSFDGFDAEADDGEVFRVKKSSQSRRLMKQMKAERKQREKQEANNAAVHTPPLPPSTPPPPPPPMISNQEVEEDLGIKIKSNLTINKLPDEPRMLSGYEAEALHMEEEDGSSDEEENGRNHKSTDDPLQEILQRGEIPDAAAIYAARKRREAARERGSKAGTPNDDRGFISLKKEEKSQGRLVQEDDSDDDESQPIHMTGTRSNTDLKKESIKRADVYVEGDEGHRRWEEQQIRKAVGVNQSSDMRSVSPEVDEDYHSPSTNGVNDKFENNHYPREALASYNLEGIKDRIKNRISKLTETYRAHCNEADKIADDVMHSQSVIEEKEKRLPEVIQLHDFYQDLRGYLSDLVECFNEKLLQIRFVEDKYHKSKASICQKLADRRREDVRDQMRELSSTNSKPTQITAEENNEEWMRQRRAAEREGRRRRRTQMRSAKVGQAPPHNDGMSSDDELSSLDQANIAKSRQDVENQARTIMSDVVEDFSSLDGVLSRMEEWKTTDLSAYNEAYVSLCLHKMIAPLVTLQLLFWNPLEDHSSIDEMDWHNKVVMYSIKHENDLTDQSEDNSFLSLVLEKVVLVKVHKVVEAAYDPTSSSQTLRLTQLLLKLRSTYPSLTGSSKQVREVLSSVMEKIKTAIDQDVYIPLGYSKQCLENPSSGHAMFLSRQVWSCVKLFKNILCWHGLLADKVIVDFAFSSLLYRYLLIGLGVTPNAVDCVLRTRQIVQAIPSDWKTPRSQMWQELQRFIKYLSSLGTTPGLPRESVKEVAQQLRSLGAFTDADQLEKKVLHNI